MITIDEYFGPWVLSDDVTAERLQNAKRLLDCVNRLLDAATEDMVTVPVNKETKSQVAGEQYGGFRPQDCPIGAQPSAKNGWKPSAHKNAEAVDVYDPNEHLDDWITDELLEEFDLYREHPTSTRSWCHLTTRRPGSGRRTFYP